MNFMRARWSNIALRLVAAMPTPYKGIRRHPRIFWSLHTVVLAILSGMIWMTVAAGCDRSDAPEQSVGEFNMHNCDSPDPHEHRVAIYYLQFRMEYCPDQPDKDKVLVARLTRRGSRPVDRDFHEVIYEVIPTRPGSHGCCEPPAPTTPVRKSEPVRVSFVSKDERARLAASGELTLDKLYNAIMQRLEVSFIYGNNLNGMRTMMNYVEQLWDPDSLLRKDLESGWMAPLPRPRDPND